MLQKWYMSLKLKYLSTKSDGACYCYEEGEPFLE
jgi:hypothetical protein